MRARIDHSLHALLQHVGTLAVVDEAVPVHSGTADTGAPPGLGKPQVVPQYQGKASCCCVVQTVGRLGSTSVTGTAKAALFGDSTPLA